MVVWWVYFHFSCHFKRHLHTSISEISTHVIDICVFLFSAAYFYVSNTKTPNENGIKLRDERGR